LNNFAQGANMQRDTHVKNPLVRTHLKAPNPEARPQLMGRIPYSLL